MDLEQADAGTLAVLMERFTDYRLPRAKRMLERVKEGETLTGYDIDWLRRVHREGRRMQPLIDRHPEYSSIISRSIDLYLEIINTGLANEKRQSGSNDPSRSPRPPGSSDSES